MLPLSAEELRQRQEFAADRAKILQGELEQAIGRRKFIDHPDDRNLARFFSGIKSLPPTVALPTVEGTNEGIRRICQDFVDSGLQWPQNPYVPAPEPV